MQLPKRILNEVYSDIRSGRLRLDSSQALSEAWRRYRKEQGIPEQTVQQRRYAYRKSFENPNPRRRTRKRNPSKWDRSAKKNPSGGRCYVMVDFIDIRLGRTFQTKAAGFRAVERANRQEKRKRWQLMTCDAARDFLRHNEYIAAKNPRKKNPAPAPRYKLNGKNPIAIYNPPGSRGLRLIYGQAFIPSIRGVKTSGAWKGEPFEHKFKSDVKIYGLPGGALMIQTIDGSRLWADERDLDKFERK